MDRPSTTELVPRFSSSAVGAVFGALQHRSDAAARGRRAHRLRLGLRIILRVARRGLEAGRPLLLRADLICPHFVFRSVGKKPGNKMTRRRRLPRQIFAYKRVAPTRAHRHTHTYARGEKKSASKATTTSLARASYGRRAKFVGGVFKAPVAREQPAGALVLWESPRREPNRADPHVRPTHRARFAARVGVKGEGSPQTRPSRPVFFCNRSYRSRASSSARPVTVSSGLCIPIPAVCTLMV